MLPLSALTPPLAKSMVKALPLPEDLVGLTALNDPFAKLVPVAVLARVREYEERRDQLLQTQYAGSEHSNAAVRQTLQECNLPGTSTHKPSTPRLPHRRLSGRHDGHSGRAAC